MVKLQVALLICYASVFCIAFRPQLIYYTDLGCSGDGLILESKQANVTHEAPRIIATSKSYSVLGLWMGYQKLDFAEGVFTVVSENLRCVNGTSLKSLKSIRYLGPPETATHSISLYEWGSFSGREVTITGPASTNIPFQPHLIFSTGSTSWTLYSGSDFNGTASCYTPSKTLWYYTYGLNSTTRNIESILRGCDCHIDHYIN